MNIVNSKNRIASESISSMFDELFNRSFSSVFMNPSDSYRPTTNVRENEEDYVLEIASPGLEKDDFMINFKDDVLTIKVENEHKEVEKDENYVLREFNYSSFERSFSLSKDIDIDRISAEYENGILKIILPKKAEVKAMLQGRNIEIK